MSAVPMIDFLNYNRIQERHGGARPARTERRNSKGIEKRIAGMIPETSGKEEQKETTFP